MLDKVESFIKRLRWKIKMKNLLTPADLEVKKHRHQTMTKSGLKTIFMN